MSKTSSLVEKIAAWLYASTMLVIVVITVITIFGFMEKQNVTPTFAWGLAILALITGLVGSGILHPANLDTAGKRTRPTIMKKQYFFSGLRVVVLIFMPFYVLRLYLQLPTWLDAGVVLVGGAILFVWAVTTLFFPQYLKSQADDRPRKPTES